MVGAEPKERQVLPDPVSDVLLMSTAQVHQVCLTWSLSEGLTGISQSCKAETLGGDEPIGCASPIVSILEAAGHVHT